MSTERVSSEIEYTYASITPSTKKTIHNTVPVKPTSNVAKPKTPTIKVTKAGSIKQTRSIIVIRKEKADENKPGSAGCRLISAVPEYLRAVFRLLAILEANPRLPYTQYADMLKVNAGTINRLLNDFYILQLVGRDTKTVNNRPVFVWYSKISLNDALLLLLQ